MRKTILPLLLAGVVMPFAAFAQDAKPTEPDAGATPPPAAGDPATPDASSTTDPAAADPSAADPATADPVTAEPTAADPTAAEPNPAAATDESNSASPATSAEPSATDAPESSTGDAGSSGDTTNKMDRAAATTASGGTFVTVPPTGAWRASDLEGKDVYDQSGESIGSITDVLVTEEGKINAVLVGVGGFLGIGRKDVAVSMSALKFGPGKTEGLKTKAEVDSEAAATAPAAGTAGSAAPDPAAGGVGGAAAPAPAATIAPVEPVVGEDNLPDRIVLNVTREELENAPAYGEPETAGQTAPTDGSAPASGEPPAASDASGSAMPADSGSTDGADKPAAQ